MQLYYAMGSAPSRAVLLFLQAINLQPEMKLLDFSTGDNMTPEYLQLNPQHTVPLLVDDGFVLSESRAILGYLAEKYAPGTTYYPNDPMSRGLVNQRLHFDIGTLYTRFHAAFLEPVFAEETSPNEHKKASLMEALGFLEAFMGDAPYIAGDKITIADYSIIVTISTLKVIGIDMTPYPKIWAWYQRCEGEMKGYKEINWSGAEMLGGMIKNQLNIP